MDETLIWIPIALAELLLLASIALGILLKRARKVERALRIRLEELEQAGQQPLASTLVPKDSPVAAQSIKTPPSSESTDIDGSIELLQQRLQVTSDCLQRVMDELQREKALSGNGQRELAALRQNLDDMAQELAALRHANARLQQELRSKKDVLGGAAPLDRSNKEKILLYIKRLRDELATLQLKLSGSEAEVLRLRKEKEALIEDHSSLTLEYERLYENFRK